MNLLSSSMPSAWRHAPLWCRAATAVSVAAAALVMSGCAQTAAYLAPGPKAELSGLAPADMEGGFAARPALRFPTGIVAAHVQADGYSNLTTRRLGGVVGSGGRFSVVTTRDNVEQAELDRLSKLPQLMGMISLNRILLPPTPIDERELRLVASRMQADLLWLYTFDTRFFDREQSTSLKMISLGLLPTRKISVSTVASGLLIDTRTGYVYGALEASAQTQALATAWNSEESADEQRVLSEHEAFSKLAAEFARTWPTLLARHGGAAAANGAAAAAAATAAPAAHPAQPPVTTPPAATATSNAF